MNVKYSLNKLETGQMAYRGSGSEDTFSRIFEWLAVTLLLTVAFFALLQVIGPQLRAVFDALWGFAQGLWG